ncbi:hypothetical protein DMB66_39220 [Actinoplanes sp. ATCC 53533]|uniref:hypothetical protein n=1 Tax=Actinoplanes sp. ATCC 53533 TaxID=1288362 RepID=UPI000F770332|nr:hypothetical protein [Actinoplanes sp. ATCC 53533]RSM53257.1 hypothetical protein DMB66_39220 [Actinoplanes sp. ATCC 53533]
MTTFSADRSNHLPITVPVRPPTRESIAGRWVREIAAAVAAALDTTFTDAGYLITSHHDLPAPCRMQVRFWVARRRVDIDVRWPDPWRAPQFGLRVGDRDITVVDDPQERPAVTLAHAAWLAIRDDLDQTAGRAITAGDGVR